MSVPVIRQSDEHETLPWLDGAQVRIVADSAAGANAVCVLTIEAARGYTAARHLHEREDELFVVLAGTMAVGLDGRWTEVAEGGTALLPRAIPHAYRITSERATLLNICTPGGLDQFFREASELLTTALPASIDLTELTGLTELTELAARYGVTYG